MCCFRHRLRQSNGRPCSPEAFGQLVGVSGATLRRWEKNLLLPKGCDLEAVASACELTSKQRAFLLRCFSAGATRTKHCLTGRPRDW